MRLALVVFLISRMVNVAGNVHIFCDNVIIFREYGTSY
jgi:hypothetical protein